MQYQPHTWSLLHLNHWAPTQLPSIPLHPAFATPTAPAFPTTWPTAPAPAQTLTTPPIPLPGSPYPPRVLQPPPVATTTSTVPPAAPQHTAVKAAPKVRSEKKPDKTRRSAPKAPSTPSTDAPSAPVNTPPPSIQPDLATLGSTTQQLAESVRLIQAQQQIFKNNVNSFSTRQTTDWPCTSTAIARCDATNAFASTCPESQTH